MNHGTKLVPVAALSFACLVACSDTTGLSPRDLDRIGGGLSIGIIETHRFLDSGMGEPDLALFVETDGSFPCINYILDSDLQIEGSEISFTLFKVKEPNVCLTAIGPAHSYLPLPPLEGDYTLSFSFRGVVDTYQTTISDLSIEVSPKEGQFTRRQEGRIWRYPPRSFALACDSQPWAEGLCAGLKSLLLSEIELSEIAFPSGGVNPYPTDSNEGGRDWRVSYFQLDREEDFLLARTAFCSFSSPRPDFSAYLLSWKNERIRSWVTDACPSGQGGS